MTDPIRGIAGVGEAPDVNPSSGAKPDETAAAAAASTPTAGDSADVGQTRSLLETINASVDAVPAVNQDRVSAVRAALAQGSYQIDPRQIATQMLRTEQDLTGLAPKAQ